MSGLPIPEHVAAYAAGVLSVHEASTRQQSAEDVADLLERIGMGRWPAAELRAAALAWLTEHVDRGAIDLAVARLRSGGKVT